MIPGLPPVRVAVVGSRWGVLPGLDPRPEWRETSREAARAYVAALVGSLPVDVLLVGGDEGPGVDGWARSANAGMRPELRTRPGAAGCPGRAAPLVRTWVVDIATIVHVVWDGRSRTAHALMTAAHVAGKLGGVAIFDAETPTGRRFR